MHRSAHPAAREAGFTLLELMAAVMIFSLMSALALVSLQDSTEMALGSVRARELRILAERKLGEIMLFEKEFDDIYENERFDDYGDDLYDGWEWSLSIRDVVIFGTTSDEAADYLFGEPDDDDDAAGTSDQTETEQKGETQFLRELTLTVSAPQEDGLDGEGDSVKIITFVPLVNYGPGGASAPPAGTGGGN